jgi:hypothetical protein
MDYFEQVDNAGDAIARRNALRQIDPISRSRPQAPVSDEIIDASSAKQQSAIVAGPDDGGCAMTSAKKSRNRA